MTDTTSLDPGACALGSGAGQAGPASSSTATLVPFRAMHSSLTPRVIRPVPAGVLRATANELPFPPTEAVRAAMKDAMLGLNLYPHALTRLEAALARQHGVEPGAVLLGPGSSLLLHVLAAATCDPGEEVLFGWRSYDAYRAVAATAGARAVTVPIHEDGRLDLDAITDAVTASTRLILLCTPNNPSGVALRKADVEVFLERVPRDVLVVLDEAYGDFCDQPDVASGDRLIAHHSNLVVLKTFSKYYGLAGLRLGYILASPPVIHGLARLNMLNGVSDLAAHAGLACMEPVSQAESARRRDLLVEERHRLSAALVRQGFEVTDSQASFVFIRAGERSAELTDFAAHRGIGIRAFDDDGARYTVQVPAVNDRFLAITEEWMSEQR